MPATAVMRHKVNEILVETELIRLAGLIASSREYKETGTSGNADESPGWLEGVSGLVDVCNDLHAACLAGSFSSSGDLPDKVIVFLGRIIPGKVSLKVSVTCTCRSGSLARSSWTCRFLF
jgi:hypothetical protein